MVRKIILLGSLLAILLLVTPVLAGGWVVITLDSLPGEVHAGEPVSLSFMVRQHGQTPTHDVTPALTAVNQATGETFQVEAVKAAKTGRFTVDVTFPAEGEWAWSISAPPFNQRAEFAPLTVLPAVPPPAVESIGIASPAGFTLAAGLRWSALALAGLALFLALRDRQQRSAATIPLTGD